MEDMQTYIKRSNSWKVEYDVSFCSPGRNARSPRVLEARSRACYRIVLTADIQLHHTNARHLKCIRYNIMNDVSVCLCFALPGESASCEAARERGHHCRRDGQPRAFAGGTGRAARRERSRVSNASCLMYSRALFCRTMLVLQ